MEFKLNKWEKILSIIASALIIISTILSFVIPKYSRILIIGIIIFGSLFLLLLIVVIIQSREINIQSRQITELKDKNRNIKTTLQSKNQRIVQLEQLINVPFFKKWHLLYTFMWRNAMPFLSNDIDMYEVSVIRKLTGKGRIKDNHISYVFYGECISNTKTFHFCVAGANNVALNRISFKARDVSSSTELEYKIINNTHDSIFKFIEIYFKREMTAGEMIRLEISWDWPKTAFGRTDYFSFPNIFSRCTKRIVLELFPTDDMHLSSVEIYKFGLSDKEPTLIEHTYNDNGCYRTIIDHPEQNADYITYYE